MCVLTIDTDEYCGGGGGEFEDVVVSYDLRIVRGGVGVYGDDDCNCSG